MSEREELLEELAYLHTRAEMVGRRLAQLDRQDQQQPTRPDQPPRLHLVR